jgi:hypothetical protein
VHIFTQTFMEIRRTKNVIADYPAGARTARSSGRTSAVSGTDKASNTAASKMEYKGPRAKK